MDFQKFIKDYFTTKKATDKQFHDSPIFKDLVNEFKERGETYPTTFLTGCKWDFNCDKLGNAMSWLYAINNKSVEMKKRRIVSVGALYRRKAFGGAYQ